MKRIMVDMSATLIHHGHVRLLRAAIQHFLPLAFTPKPQDAPAHVCAMRL